EIAGAAMMIYLQKRVIDQNGRSPSSTENSKIRCGMTVVLVPRCKSIVCRCILSQAVNASHDTPRIFEMQLRIFFQKVMKTFSYFSDLGRDIPIFLPRYGN
ncbi:hypothetical protein, partial [Aeromonas caviae]|uniref:hypothetical protein n=1 Tax=Aeromonas caviae TaxID=648 RepID=UPI001FC862E5